MISYYSITFMAVSSTTTSKILRNTILVSELSMSYLPTLAILPAFMSLVSDKQLNAKRTNVVWSNYGVQNMWKQQIRSSINRRHEQKLWEGSAWWHEDNVGHANPDLLKVDLSRYPRCKLKLAEVTGWRKYGEWKFYKYRETMPWTLPPARERDRIRLSFARGCNH